MRQTSGSRLRLAVATTRIVTASSSNHFSSSLQLLRSIEAASSKLAVHYWDLGLTRGESAWLREAFPRVCVRAFPYELFPPHFEVAVDAGQYAWKPAILYMESLSHIGTLLWLDAGNVVTRIPIRTLNAISRRAYYSPFSSGCVRDWTHPGTIHRLKATDWVCAQRNLNGAIVGFNTSNQSFRSLLRDWFDCAMNRDCIAPPGSNRMNHRQDQAVLSVLAWQSGLAGRELLRNRREILIHQDVEA